MTTDDIYKAAKECGLARSLRQFSRDFLGRCPHYAADRGLTRCSAGALLNLYKRLGELGHTDLQAIAFKRLLDADGRGDRAGAACP